VLQLIMGKLGLSRTYQLSKSAHWNASRGYMKTDEHSTSALRLRPKNDGVTTTIAGCPGESAPTLFNSVRPRNSVESIELAGITKTVEISFSRDAADTVSH
jgi:hypothetical protein